ncbi:MAG: hypothetical protein ACI9RO_000417 [Alteromonas macleodii]|jgi:hypothetical protein
MSKKFMMALSLKQDVGALHHIHKRRITME